MPNAFRWVLALVAVSLAFAWWQWAPASPAVEVGLPTGTQEAARADLGSGSPNVGGTAGTPEALSAERAPEDRTALLDDSVVEEESLPPPGTLRAQVEESGVPLARWTARVGNETRFARLQSEGSDILTASLTPGTYQLWMHAPGCEPERRDDIVITAEEITDLGTITLQRGSGRIEGRVTARHQLPGESVFVSLRGKGRNPCSRCSEALVSAHRPEVELSEDLDDVSIDLGGNGSIRVADNSLWTVRSEGSEFGVLLSGLEAVASSTIPDGEDDGAEEVEVVQELAEAPDSEPVLPEELQHVCRHCGFGENESVVATTNQSGFAFSNLASGAYRARAWCNETQKVGETSVVELGPGGWAWVDFSFSESGQVRLVLVDSKEVPFTGLKPTDDGTGEEPIGPIVFTFLQEDEVCATATVHPSGMMTLRFSASSWFLGNYGVEDQTRSDGPREEGDILDAMPDAPERHVQRLSVETEAPHEFTVHDLPLEPWTVVVRCDTWSSDPTPLDFRRSRGPHVLVMHPDREGPDDEDIVVLGENFFDFDSSGSIDIQLR